MRILHVLHSYPPESRAGSENYVEALVRAQAARHEVRVLHRVAEPDRPEYELREAKHEGASVLRLNRTFRDLASFRDTYRSDDVAARFDEVLGRWRPDVVHFHHLTCLSTTCVHAAKRRGVPVVLTLHDFWLLCPRGQLLRRDLSLCESHTTADCVRCMAHQLPIRGGAARVARLWGRAARLRRLPLPPRLYGWLASLPFRAEREAAAEIDERMRHVLEACALVDRFVSPSRFVKQRFVELGIPRERIVVEDNGFDLGPWRGAPERLPAADGRLRLAYLGTWIPSKGVHVLVEAVRELDPGRTVLEIHGRSVPYDGVEAYEAALIRLAEGSPHILFRGPYEPRDIPSILAGVDVLVVPSIWYENSPLTVHEAFLAGVPVVASDHGGLRELVEHEVNGLRFQPRSAPALRVALRRLLDEPGLLDRLRRSRVPVAAIGEHALRLEALYQAARPAPDLSSFPVGKAP